METIITLQEELDHLTSAINEQLPQESKEQVQNGVDEIKQYFDKNKSINVGDEVPDFTLLNFDGKTRTLSSYLKDGAVVLSFFRGEWCPYCNLQIANFQKHLPEIENQGAKLITVSPSMPDYQLVMKEKHKLTFDVLTDLGGVVAKKYGLAFDLPQSIHEVYKLKFNLDVSKYNKDGSLTIPLPATYVIGQDRKVKYAFVDIDWTKRTAIEDILTALN